MKQFPVGMSIENYPDAMSNQWWNEQPGSGAFEASARTMPKTSAEPRTHDGCGGQVHLWHPNIKAPRGCGVCWECREVVELK